MEPAVHDSCNVGDLEAFGTEVDEHYFLFQGPRGRGCWVVRHVLGFDDVEDDGIEVRKGFGRSVGVCVGL